MIWDDAQDTEDMQEDMMDFELLDPLKPLRTYLVTYSQCDFNKCETRERFGEIVSEAFRSKSCKVVPEHWAVCLEKHMNGGYHYHASIALSGPKKWVKVRQQIEKNHGIRVNFAIRETGGYYAAYRYVTKSDTSFYVSPNHPNMASIGSPQTKGCLRAHARKRRRSVAVAAAASQVQVASSSSAGNAAEEIPAAAGDVSADAVGSSVDVGGGGGPVKRLRLTNFHLFQFILKENITDIDQLLKIANEQYEQKKTDLASFVLNKTEKQLGDVLKMTWRMRRAKNCWERKNSGRMEILLKVHQNEICTCDEPGKWFNLAVETLSRNGINKYVFAYSIRDLLEHGRSKFRNLMIVGPSNCAKTFLWKPLEIIFETFANPANNKYGWIGVENAELILLNDIRLTNELIKWDDFLRLLEGHTVNLPAPKNHFSTDIKMNWDSPIFATTKDLGSIKFLDSRGNGDEAEDEMMINRWKVFTFHHKIKEADVTEATECPKCFTDLVMMGNE